ncbi:MAG: hypothetical protein JWQ09_438, partial [Segetibacter sp.]|nr:hypothetical protein [Segetibacter sp.]
SETDEISSIAKIKVIEEEGIVNGENQEEEKPNEI